MCVPTLASKNVSNNSESPPKMSVSNTSALIQNVREQKSKKLNKVKELTPKNKSINASKSINA